MTVAAGAADLATPAACLVYWMSTLLPGPPSRMSWPGPPLRMSSPGAAEQRVVPVAAVDDVVAVAAVGRNWIASAARPEPMIDVVAGEAVDRELVLRRVGVGDVDDGRETGDADLAARTARGDHVVLGGSVDDDLVGGPVVDPPWPPARSVWISVRSVPETSLTVAVGAAERVEVDLLDAGQIHRDVPTSRMNRIRRPLADTSNCLGDVRAVERHRVVAA